jgi:hypothetical protein
MAAPISAPFLPPAMAPTPAPAPVELPMMSAVFFHERPVLVLAGDADDGQEPAVQSPEFPFRRLGLWWTGRRGGRSRCG